MNLKSNDIIEHIQENVQWLDKDAIVQILRYNDEANERFTMMCDDIETFNNISEQASFIDIDEDTFDMVLESLDGLNKIRQNKISMANRMTALRQTKIETPAITPKVQAAAKVADKAYQARGDNKQMVAESVKERIMEKLRRKEKEKEKGLINTDTGDTTDIDVSNIDKKESNIKKAMTIKNGIQGAAGLGMGYFIKRVYDEYKKKRGNKGETDAETMDDDYKDTIAESLDLNVLLGEDNVIYVERDELIDILSLCEDLDVADLLEDIKMEVNHNTDYKYLDCDIEIL